MIADPLGRLGGSGVGSPDDTARFIDYLIDVGLNETLAVLILHHLRKEPTADEIDELSGAWGGHPDTVLLLKRTKTPGRRRLSFPKLRYAAARLPLILGDAGGGSFEVIAEEGADEGRDIEAETLTFLALDENRGRWFTAKTIAAELHRAERDVKRVLGVLLEAGEVEFEKHPGASPDSQRPPPQR